MMVDWWCSTSSPQPSEEESDLPMNVLTERRGWIRASHPAKASLVMLSRKEPYQFPTEEVHSTLSKNVLPWVWVPYFSPLSCKASLFRRLEAARKQAKEAGDERFDELEVWPETWIIRSPGEAKLWHSANASGSSKNYDASSSVEPRQFVVDEPETAPAPAAAAGEGAREAGALVAQWTVLQDTLEAMVASALVRTTAVPIMVLTTLPWGKQGWQHGRAPPPAFLCQAPKSKRGGGDMGCEQRRRGVATPEPPAFEEQGRGKPRNSRAPPLRAVVVQAAVVPAQLPNGPSNFELRVWAIIRRDRVYVLSSHRAKTATSGLMNKMQQKEYSDYGAHYPFNIASEQAVREALGPYRCHLAEAPPPPPATSPAGAAAQEADKASEQATQSAEQAQPATQTPPAPSCCHATTYVYDQVTVPLIQRAVWLSFQAVRHDIPPLEAARRKVKKKPGVAAAGQGGGGGGRGGGCRGARTTGAAASGSCGSGSWSTSKGSGGGEGGKGRTSKSGKGGGSCSGSSVKGSMHPKKTGGGFFVWVGFDFIVTAEGRPYMIEANVKPSTRFRSESQFPSHDVCGLAKAAFADLARLVEEERQGGPRAEVPVGVRGVSEVDFDSQDSPVWLELNFD
eukprot:CAMPEP_0171801486 /NCGR_PEP_ID=MMETSP0991-20121206/72286_1 /TAXON_ID=483369 /ORGANISM="non described non described, Strain CCMP2098" /LENGTH=621 /DNA_ID=CAMNT_0012413161 /DNA_START=96 /DNA_END=1964 /DNA_ORIENTATION=-